MSCRCSFDIFLMSCYILFLQFEDDFLSVLVDAVQVELQQGDRFALRVSDDVVAEKSVKRYSKFSL